MLGDALYVVTGLIACGWLVVVFFKQKADFPRFWIRVSLWLAIFATLNAIGASLMALRFPNLWTHEELFSGFRSVFYAWIGLWIWSTYLTKSRRVKNTFVK